MELCFQLYVPNFASTGQSTWVLLLMFSMQLVISTLFSIFLYIFYLIAQTFGGEGQGI